MIKMSEYAKRRKTLMQKIGSQSILFIPAYPHAKRNADADYPYRPNSDLYYLTGFNEPETILVLAPKRADGEFILFNRKRDRSREIWDGLRAGQAGACETFGADQAFPIEDFARMLPELLEGRQTIHCSLGAEKYFDDMLLTALNSIRGRIRNGIQAPITLTDITDTLHEMRLFKSMAEIKLMRKAATISAGAHMRAIQACKPGMNESQLEAEIMHEFQKNGAAFAAYSSIVGAGANSCILHYIENNQTIKNGDIVLIDAGCEYDYYAADITRTFPANGKFSTEQKIIYEIVLASQMAALKVAKPGTPFASMQKAIVRSITEGLLKHSILKGNLEDLIAKEAYLPFYMHKSGHWLGLDVHDMGRYKVAGKWRTLEPGMVLTVEPGIYISADNVGVHKKWHNIGIRIEDDIVITEEGHEVLSKDVPKTVADIERLMNSHED